MICGPSLIKSASAYDCAPITPENTLSNAETRAITDIEAEEGADLLEGEGVTDFDYIEHNIDTRDSNEEAMRKVSSLESQVELTDFPILED